MFHIRTQADTSVFVFSIALLVDCVKAIEWRSDLQLVRPQKAAEEINVISLERAYLSQDVDEVERGDRLSGPFRWPCGLQKEDELL